ncbi:MAG: hypothetical protein KF911_04615 [Pseudomonadales bacterium]|nr:hypothetical protein [Pseudomonadales bacterium]
MIKAVPVLLLCGGVLVGMAAPQTARAHEYDPAVVFVTGAAIGYLLSDGGSDRHVHHYHGHRPHKYHAKHYKKYHKKHHKKYHRGDRRYHGAYYAPARQVHHYHRVDDRYDRRYR